FTGEDGICTYIPSQADSYINASDSCKVHGGVLVTMKTSLKQQLVADALNKRPVWNNWLWIGLDDMQQEGTFIWSDGATCTVDEQNLLFYGGKPSPRTREEDCAVLSKSTFLVNDVICTYKYSYICEIKNF
ncbi:unnamed protein product, partial [Lymnaea stagnalis]